MLLHIGGLQSDGLTSHHYVRAYVHTIRRKTQKLKRPFFNRAPSCTMDGTYSIQVDYVIPSSYLCCTVQLVCEKREKPKSRCQIDMLNNLECSMCVGSPTK